ncbi:MAG: hypothetical protein R3F11_22445 [Verrucomicrobiales bacterium]
MAKILYCRCAYAQAVPEGVKNDVLERLCASGAAFECVPDLCEMSARRDPKLAQLAESAANEPLKIAACHPRAVKWLFHAAGSALPDHAEVLNMREQSADEIAEALEEEG